MWVNQPSSLQTFHSLHTSEVLACDDGADIITVYFVSGMIISQHIKRSALSEGWPSSRRSTCHRLLVLATKHCPKGHHDWEEILRIAGELDESP